MNRWHSAIRVLAWAVAIPAVAEVRLSGRVTTDTNTAIPDAKITLSRPPYHVVAFTDPTGAFSFDAPAAGAYSLEADHDGYFVHRDIGVELGAAPREIHIVLATVYQLKEVLDVKATPGVADADRTAPQVTLGGERLLDLPYRDTNSLRNMLRLIPGVTQDSRGGIHVHGGAEDQTLFTLEGFQINDPHFGVFDTRMNIESVQSVEMTAARPSAEFGKGSAGVIAVHTRTGSDELQFSTSTILPSFQSQKGALQLADFTPRANFSGPWRKGKAWFSDSFDVQFNVNVIPELPDHKDRNKSLRGSNLLHNQINIAPSNIFFAGLLINAGSSPHSGLTALDPIESSSNRRNFQRFAYFKDQIYLSRGAVLEFGYALNHTEGNESPNSPSPYWITPLGRRGGHFSSLDREADRQQWIANAIPPVWRFLGAHSLKVGADIDWLSYSQQASRGPIIYTDNAGSPLRRIEFVGSGNFRRTNVEIAGYVQDSWRVRPGLLFELGMRLDWDRILQNWNGAPRFGFAWTPPGLANTKLFGGFSRIFDAGNLRLFTRPLDQQTITTLYDRGLPVGDPTLSVYRLDDSRLKNPQHDNWNVGIEQRLPHNLQIRTSLVERRGLRGFTFTDQSVAQPSAYLTGQNPNDALNVLGLYGHRHDYYKAAQIFVRQPLHQQYEWVAGYTRSLAKSNAVMERTVDQILLVADNTGPLPWNTPNRLMTWGLLPSGFKDLLWGYMAEWRNGYPFSIHEQDGRVRRPIDGYTFPAFFELNMHAERRFVVRGYRLAIRGGMVNLTGHANPNTVNNIIGSRDFLNVYGGQRRSTIFRLLWLGKS